MGYVMSKKIWIPLFSQTGTELLHLLNMILSTTPVQGLIYSNNLKGEINPILLEQYPVKVMKHDSIMQEIKFQSEQFTDHEIIVTLHGYLRIIPKEIVDLPNVKIYNSHPGDIVKYPELRGLDPQKKAWDLNLNSTGVVLHQVDEGVDTGPIIMKGTLNGPIRVLYKSEEKLIEALRFVSIQLWNSHLRSIL